jgi:hypothetical protein
LAERSEAMTKGGSGSNGRHCYCTPRVVCWHPELIRCFRCEGDECPKCGGSGFRERKRCAGCEVPAGHPSQSGKALQPERGVKSWKKLRSLPLYCMDCNPRFLRTGLALFEGMGG